MERCAAHLLTPVICHVTVPRTRASIVRSHVMPCLLGRACLCHMNGSLGSLNGSLVRSFTPFVHSPPQRPRFTVRSFTTWPAEPFAEPFTPPSRRSAGAEGARRATRDGAGAPQTPSTRPSLGQTRSPTRSQCHSARWSRGFIRLPKQRARKVGEKAKEREGA